MSSSQDRINPCWDTPGITNDMIADYPTVTKLDSWDIYKYNDFPLYPDKRNSVSYNLAVEYAETSLAGYNFSNLKIM